jgi:hypothetical protein
MENWYNKASGNTINRVKHYKTTACLSCPLFSRCTVNKKGRLIERSEHMDLIEANKARLQKKPGLVSKAPSHCRASFWRDKTSVGFLLPHDQKEHQTRLFRCGSDIYGLQSPAHF